MRQLPKYRVLILTGLVALLAGLAAGCSTPEPPAYEVTGKVTYDGKPLTTGNVILVPDVDKGNKATQEARGTIDEQGNYKALTDKNAKGVLPGWYKVGVTSTKKDPKNEYAVPTSLIPERYREAKSSGLTLEVVEKASPGAYDLKLNK